MALQLNKLDKNLKRKILEAARSIRKKYMALKLDRADTDEALNKFLNPITQPLQTLVKNSSSSSKKNKLIKLKQEREETIGIQPEKKPRVEPVGFLKTDTIAASDDDYNQDESRQHDDVFEQETQDDFDATMYERPEVFEQYIEQYPAKIREFLHMFFSQSKEIDTTHGIIYDPKLSNWTLGSETVNFTTNGDIKINNVTYKGTQGLYELLFLKNPIYHTENDKKDYREILKQTGVYQKEDGSMKGNRSSKYTNIVKPLMTAKSRIPTTSPIGSVRNIASTSRIKSQASTTPPAAVAKPAKQSTTATPKTGKALIEYNEKPREFIYYNDVNELVDRFQKLQAAKEAGNNNTHNEIINILHELARLGVIVFDDK